MPVKGFSYDYSKIFILNALISFGGSIKKPSATKVLYDRMIELGFQTEALPRKSLGQKLRNMEEEGLILRDVEATRTREIIILIEAIPESLLSQLTLSSPIDWSKYLPDESQTTASEVTAEEIASSLLAQVVEVLLKPTQEPTVVVYDDQTKQKLADALKELESLRISLSSAKARIASLEQENSVLQNNVQKLANSRVVVDERIGQGLFELVHQPKTTK